MTSTQTAGSAQTGSSQFSQGFQGETSQSSSPIGNASSAATPQEGGATTEDRLKAFTTPLDRFLNDQQRPATDSEQNPQSQQDDTLGGSLVSGAAGGNTGMHIPPEAVARKAAHDFYQEVSQADKARKTAIGGLGTAKSARNQELNTLKNTQRELLKDKPGAQDFKANNDRAKAWIAQQKQVQQQLKAAESRHQSIVDRHQQAYDRADAKVKAIETRYGVDKLGPVAGVTVDNLTLKPHYALNTPESPLKAHDTLDPRITETKEKPRHDSIPGSHAEAVSADQALKARKHDVSSANPVTRLAYYVETLRPPEGQLRGLTAQQLWISGDTSKAQGMSEGSPAPRCGNCEAITDGVDNLAGNSRKTYLSEANTEAPNSGGAKTQGSDSPQEKHKPDFSGHNREAMKSGAKSGAAAGFLTGVWDSYNRGDLNATDIAWKTGLGAGTGTVAGLIEETSARQLIGNSNQATRVVAGRLGGASVAGGLINAGFSSYEQIQAYERGEVTGAQAIGTVVSETAVGVGAGAAGAAIGATVGSIIPGAGTLVGGAIGFCVGAAAGWVADSAARGLGIDKAVAHGVTSLIDWVTGG
jgi:hypothetical protein